MAKPNLFGLDRSALARCLAAYDAPEFHAGQICAWLYGRRRLDPATWTDLPRALRERLVEDVVVDRGAIEARTTADDGTIKYRITLAGGGRVEAVSMVQSDRHTLCLSSQVGCALDCDFCLTGKMGFTRHLDPGEILGQVSLIQDDRDLGPAAPHLVFMGMGEPLHNYAHLVAALELLTAPGGFALPPRRITVSTSGLAPAIERLAGAAVRPRLAVSLNATTDAIRDRLMPINRKYSLERLLAACRAYGRATGEPYTFEYVLLRGINDTDADVERLARIGATHRAKLNLIPFNPVPGWLHYHPPDDRRVATIRDTLLDRGVRVSIRWSRGARARAACGQLALLPDTPPRDTTGGLSP